MSENTAPGCDLCGLDRLCLFGRVSGLRIRRIRTGRGTPIFRSGERVDALFAIRSGCVKEVDVNAGRPGTILNFATAGEILSLQSLESAPSRTTAITVEPSFVCIVPWTAVDQSSANAPWVTRELMQLIAKAGLEARQSLALVRDKEARQRVAGFLLNMLARAQVHSVHSREFRLAMNRDDIANYLGIRSETVSRCFTGLAREKLIRVKAKRVQILDESELRRVYAGSEVDANVIEHSGA
jgi:CRP/FNR family transcriptional regulator, anaerobic regulatory protein